MAGVAARARGAYAKRRAKSPTRRPPSDVVRVLVKEAGNKCANPGCAAWRTHIHHIHEWSVHKTHDQAFMIAVCPTCHDSIHHGTLPFSDELLLQWKAIARPQSPKYAHLYVEPGGAPAFQLGSIFMRANQGGGMTFLKAANGTRLGLRVPDQDIVEVDLVLCDTGGKRLIDTRAGNHIRLGDDEEVEVKTAPGAVEVRVPADRRFIPEWMLPILLRSDPHLVTAGRVRLAAARVIEPSVVKIEGIWPMDEHRAIVLDGEWMILYDRFVVGLPTRIRGQPGERISMTFDEQVSSVFSRFKLSLSAIFGKRNFSHVRSPCVAFFIDGSAVALEPYVASVNGVHVNGPKDSTADYFKRFLVRVEWRSTMAKCRFHDGTTISIHASGGQIGGAGHAT
jgi:hypothetical protein